MLRLLRPTLIGDVLLVGIVGRLDRLAMQLVVDSAANCLPPHGPDFGAVLLDLSAAEPVQPAACALAKAWHLSLPMRPCAMLRRTIDAGFAREVALLLAGAPTRPIPMDTFGSCNRDAALRWCQLRAATFRDEVARRRRT